MAGFLRADGVEELGKAFAGLFSTQSSELPLGNIGHFGDVSKAVIVIIVGTDVFKDGSNPGGAGLIGLAVI